MNGRIRNGQVVCPVNGIKQTDVYFKDGKFSAPFDGPYDVDIDATGLAVFPGLIDAHAHLRDPGFEYREDIETGTRSAAHGGYTSVACMPNTKPVCDNAAVVSYIIQKAKEVGHVNVFPIGAVSKGQKGEELAEIGLMKEAGIVAVSDDGAPVSTANMMRKGMIYAADFGLTVINHCEDPSLAKGYMNEGYNSTKMGVAGVPSAAEDIMVARDIILAEYLDLPVHLAHISTKGAIRMIRRAKADGVKVTAETCPHYFCLTDDACLGFNTYARVNPPLRRPEDVEAVIEALKDGTLDMIATDHAPHHQDEKDVEFDKANNGFIGFETAFALGYTYLVLPGHLTLPQLAEKMSKAPSDLLKLGRGTFAEGTPADLMLADLNEAWVVDRFKMHSKSTNSPYHGMELKGKVKATLVNGKVVFDDKLC